MYRIKLFAPVALLLASCTTSSKEPSTASDFCQTGFSRWESDVVQDLKTLSSKSKLHTRKIKAFLESEEGKNCKKIAIKYLKAEQLRVQKGRVFEPGTDSLVLLAHSMKWPNTSGYLSALIQQNPNNHIYWSLLQRHSQASYKNLLYKMLTGLTAGQRAEEGFNLLRKPQGLQTTLRKSLPLENNRVPLMMASRVPEAQWHAKELGQVLSALNFVLAKQGPNTPLVLHAKLKDFLFQNQEVWIRTLRYEPAEIQFALMRVLKQVGGGHVVQHLMATAQNHTDARLRGLAQDTISKLGRN